MIKVYSKPNCMQCNFTKKYLDDQGADYEAVDVTKDDEAMDHVKALGYASLPVVEYEGGHFAGFRPDELTKVLEGQYE